MAKAYGRIHRLLKILTLIQSQRGWNAERLAQECGTSVRNVYRDLKMLEGAGVPYHHDKTTGGYHVRRDFFMPPVDLTLQESLALVTLAEQVAGKGQIPFLHAAAMGIAKIKGQLPSKLRRVLAGIDPQVDIRLAPSGSEDGIADVHETVVQAIADRRALRCTYESLRAREAGGAEEIFLFHPYRLFFSQRAWYAVGHHSGRGEVRKLKLSRFSRIHLTDETFTVPSDFSLDEHLGNAWRMIRGTPTCRVELYFDAEFAENIADTYWHATQEIEHAPDGSILFRCTVDGLDEIVWWVLSMGPHCRVLEPPELAARVRDLAGQMVAQYDPPN